jgi:murein DD-endopeptidase MepM/ murein hydrolase activator NlpD
MKNQGKNGYGRYLRVVSNGMDEKGRYKELTFAHLASYATGLKVGQIVYCGDKIGMMGGAPNTDGAGFSSGMHLHQGLRFLDKNKAVLNYDNGYKGSVDFLQYILYLQDQVMVSQNVTFPNG